MAPPDDFPGQPDRDDDERRPARMWQEADGPARRREYLLAVIDGRRPDWPTLDDLRAGSD